MPDTNKTNGGTDHHPPVKHLMPLTEKEVEHLLDYRNSKDNDGNGNGKFNMLLSSIGPIMVPLLVAAVSILATWIFKLDDRVYQIGLNTPSVATYDKIVRTLDEITPVVRSNSDWRKTVEESLAVRGERIAKLEAELGAKEETIKELERRLEILEKK